MPGRIIRNIPNLITCCNLLSGCVAVVATMNGNVQTAFIFILAGAAFDFCDGLAARLLHAYSPMGKELDSLADLITFGLAPALMCFKALCNIEWPEAIRLIPYAAFILAAAAALRLARFNIETHPDTTFSGLAVPANAIFWCGQILWIQGAAQPFYGYILIAEAVLFSLLMTSRIPMFSLKFHNLTWKDNSIRYIFLIVMPLFIILSGIKGVACIILWYIILSVLTCRK